MKRITSHHDGHGRMEKLLVLALDEPATEPPGNSSHHLYGFVQAPYALPGVTGEQLAERIGEVYSWDQVGKIQFQRGPFDQPGSTPGTLTTAVIAALVDHLEGFQKGPLANRETALAITHLEIAMWAIRSRADKRAAAGTLGTMGK